MPDSYPKPDYYINELGYVIPGSPEATAEAIQKEARERLKARHTELSRRRAIARIQAERKIPVRDRDR